jgi:endo-1,4-beta-xylanase
MNPGDSWVLGDLSAAATQGTSASNTQNVAAYAKTPQGLQTLATSKRPGFLVGAAMALGPAVADSQYAALAFGGNFGQLTTENALKWQFSEPQPGVFDFSEADALVALAAKNRLAVHGHTLVFGEANPKWVQDLPVSTAADKQHVKQVMIDHITQTVSHFKGKISSWDVVNEPLADLDAPAAADGLRQHIWYKAMGASYIATAFTAAHQADPNAKLYLNDFGLEENGDRWNTLLALVTQLKSQGVPINGVGFEAHIYAAGDEIDPAVLRSHIQALAGLGLTVRISEMDVYSDNGTAAQATQYANVFNACFSEPNCVSWSTWGITDRYDMFQDDNNRLQYGQDLLWDAQLHPTPAYNKIQQSLL